MTKEREIEIVNIDGEYYVIDLKFNTYNYVGMVVVMNGGGSGTLKRTVEPYKFPMAGATYKIIASSKELFAEPHQIIDKRIFEAMVSVLPSDEEIEEHFYVNEDRMSAGDKERLLKQEGAKWMRNFVEIRTNI